MSEPSSPYSPDTASPATGASVALGSGENGALRQSDLPERLDQEFLHNRSMMLTKPHRQTLLDARNELARLHQVESLLKKIYANRAVRELMFEGVFADDRFDELFNQHAAMESELKKLVGAA